VATHALIDYFANEQRRLDGLAAMAEYQRPRELGCGHGAD
jgi:hypothetical protein